MDPQQAGGQSCRPPCLFTVEQIEAQKVREDREAVWRSMRGSTGVSGKRAPLGPRAQCACLPAPPPSAAEPIRGWDLLALKWVPVSLSSSSLTSSTWRKTGSWALPGNRNTPFLSSGLEDAAVVGEPGDRTRDSMCGRALGQARVHPGPHCPAEGLPQ